MATRVTGGDLSAVQARLVGWQGRRETTTATFGNERDEVFAVPLEGAVEPPSDEPPLPPWEQPTKVSVIYAVVKCEFGVAYSDTPHMIVDLSLQDGEEWDGADAPYVTACVVSWRRLPAHEIYVGARVAVAVYNHPIGTEAVTEDEEDDPFKMMLRLAFNGPAVATPMPGVIEAVDTTDGPDWDLPEE